MLSWWDHDCASIFGLKVHPSNATGKFPLRGKVQELDWR